MLKMVVTKEEQEFYLQALKVEFITSSWELKLYAKALKIASEWGEKIDKENKAYFKKNRLADKYNI